MMKKTLFLLLLSGLLVGCGKEVNKDTVSQSNENSFIEQGNIQDLTFTSGVDESGFSQADIQNYLNIEGQSSNNKNVYVIYNGTIVDEIKPDSTGNFKYHSRTNKDITQLVFSNDENLKFGDLEVQTEDLSNYKKIIALPNDEFVSSQITTEDVPASNEFKVGESAQFTSDTGNSIKVTINSLEKFSGDDRVQPKGIYFLKVTYTIENLSSEEYPANALMFSAYDGNNEKAESISKDYFSEKIAAGKKASGTSYFDVKNEGPFEIHSFGAYWTGDIN